jgi:hypothetical protein
MTSVRNARRLSPACNPHLCCTHLVHLKGASWGGRALARRLLVRPYATNDTYPLQTIAFGISTPEKSLRFKYHSVAFRRTGQSGLLVAHLPRLPTPMSKVAKAVWCFTAGADAEVAGVLISLTARFLCLADLDSGSTLAAWLLRLIGLDSPQGLSASKAQPCFGLMQLQCGLLLRLFLLLEFGFHCLSIKSSKSDL